MSVLRRSNVLIDSDIYKLDKGNKHWQSTPTLAVQTSEYIVDFLNHYRVNHWHAVAQEVRNLLEERFTASSNHESSDKVQALLFHRAKKKDSLEIKLKYKDLNDKKGPFKSVQDIGERVKDLAGVRVVLIVPSEKQFTLVKNVIEDIFGKELDVKTHLGNKPIALQQDQNNPGEVYQPTHGGYEGVHYRPKLDKVKFRNPNFQVDEGDRVEIQVTTALQHAWAEAGHDITYKSYIYGKAPHQELAIYDALHGLVKSGNLLLKELHQSVNQRTYMPFEDPYQLEVFLKKYLKEEAEDLLPSLEELLPRESSEILLKILRHTANDYPLAVRNILKRLQFPGNEGKDQLRSFKPTLEPSSETRLMICVAQFLIRGDFQEPHGKEAVGKCRVMMSALCLLQNVKGFRWSKGEVGKYIADVLEPSEEEQAALQWLVNSEHRYALLKDNTPERGDQNDRNVIDKNTCSAWSWFVGQAQTRSSICGLCFRLAIIDAAKPFELYQSLYELNNMGPISRSSTSDPYGEFSMRSQETSEVTPRAASRRTIHFEDDPAYLSD